MDVERGQAIFLTAHIGLLIFDMVLSRLGVVPRVLVGLSLKTTLGRVSIGRRVNPSGWNSTSIWDFRFGSLF